LFLSEAFTRPRVTDYLAKLGFTQSYTYFTWRTSADEVRSYLEELTTPPVSEYLRPSLWPNTPDILTEEIQLGGAAALRARVVLAATLSANYGIYGPPLEHAEVEAREPGSEEYRRSEKYEIRWRDVAGGAAMRELIARLNAIRRDHPALTMDGGLRFHDADNPMLLAYSKRDARADDTVLVVVNMDHRYPQSGWIDLDLPSLGLGWDVPFVVEDLLGGGTYAWHGARNFARLEPARAAAHIFQVVRR
jgi:starch synthase (maltosyl-transferring)